MVDAIILFLLFVVFISGFARGILGQLWSLAVLALTTFVTSHIYLSFTHLTSKIVHHGDGSKLLSFAAVFAVISVILNGPVLALIKHSRDRWEEGAGFGDRLAAAILGVIEGIGFLQVASVLLVAYPVLGWDEWIKASNLIRFYVGQWPFMIPLLPSELHKVAELLR